VWPARVRFFKDEGKRRYLQPRSLALLGNDCRIRLYIPSIRNCDEHLDYLEVVRATNANRYLLTGGS